MREKPVLPEGEVMSEDKREVKRLPTSGMGLEKEVL